jgi:uncharacterized membrane protein YfcA
VHGFAASIFLVVSGVVAGVIGTAGGITSLVAYPALLAVGIPPLTANVTNAVALLGSGLGSALRAGPDVAGHSRTLKVWLPPTVIFSLGGAVLLVLTPGAVFDRVVPFLVATGSLLLLLQPLISRWQVRRGRPLHPALVAISGAGVAAYNGYFGAGSGILMIALLLITTEPVLHRANALKNVILLAADILPAVLFAVLGTVVWRSMWPLAIGAVLGGLIGPSIARRVPAVILRVLIGLCGFGLAVYLFLHA